MTCFLLFNNSEYLGVGITVGLSEETNGDGIFMYTNSYNRELLYED
jgi:hypothetical protein